jgi:hypothetical protein
VIGGLVIFVAAAGSHVELLHRPESFDISEGAEQSVLIFEVAGIYALAEGYLLLRNDPTAFWLRKAITFVVMVDSFIWLAMGGPAYEPWYFSSAVGALFVASAWSIALRKPKITPNCPIERDAPQAGRPSS